MTSEEIANLLYLPLTDHLLFNKLREESKKAGFEHIYDMSTELIIDIIKNELNRRRSNGDV
jgi:hypothetical protein